MSEEGKARSQNSHNLPTGLGSSVVLVTQLRLDVALYELLV